MTNPQPDIQRIETNPRISRVLIHNGIVYLSGTVADDASVSVEDQTKSILNKFDKYLAQAGSHKTRLLSAIVWLRDVADAPKMNSVWQEWMPEGFSPSRACVQATPARKEFSIEIMAQASVGPAAV